MRFFQAPVAVDPWTGVLDTTQSGQISIQENYVTKILDGSEDCLNLNVYTPQVSLISNHFQFKFNLMLTAWNYQHKAT